MGSISGALLIEMDREVLEEMERRKRAKDDPCDSCGGLGGAGEAVCADCLGQGILLTKEEYATIVRISGLQDVLDQDDSVLEYDEIS